MEDGIFMTVLDGIYELNEGILDKLNIVVEDLRFGDGGEQISSCTKIKDHINIMVFVDDLVEGDDVGVVTNHLMKCKFAILELFLVRPALRLEQTFDSVVPWLVEGRGYFNSTIDLAVCTRT